MELLIKLLIAHLIADFFLQWPALLANKNKKKFLSPYLYLHCLIHGALTLLIVWDVHLLPGIAFIVVTHCIFDGLKVSLQNHNNRRILFFIDQLLHLAVIVLVAHYYAHLQFDILANYDIVLLHTLLLIFVTAPVSISIQTIFTRWELSGLAAESLVDAGKYIGYIERILIYGAIVTNQWQIIGFLLAAKSIFRFNDIKEKAQIQFTEYVFLGTLFSFAFAIAAGMTYQLLYKYI